MEKEALLQEAVNLISAGMVGKMEAMKGREEEERENVKRGRQMRNQEMANMTGILSLFIYLVPRRSMRRRRRSFKKQLI